MTTLDLRNLPAEVQQRIADADPSFLASRHRGFDIDYRGRVLEHRATPRVEVRLADDQPPEIHGYASIYEVPYEVAGGAPYGWTETIARGAADKSVREQDGVFMFFDHEGLPLASTKAGSLRLESDNVGLYSAATIDPRSAWSMEIVHRLDSGDLDAMSFAFQVLRQEWNEDYTERRILEVKLFDVSVVSFPANPATVVGLRNTEPPAAARSGLSLSLARAQAQALSLH